MQMNHEKLNLAEHAFMKNVAAWLNLPQTATQAERTELVLSIIQAHRKTLQSAVELYKS